LRQRGQGGSLLAQVKQQQQRLDNLQAAPPRGLAYRCCRTHPAVSSALDALLLFLRLPPLGDRKLVRLKTGYLSVWLRLFPVDGLPEHAHHVCETDIMTRPHGTKISLATETESPGPPEMT
jgi:hypothetical protein